MWKVDMEKRTNQEKQKQIQPTTDLKHQVFDEWSHVSLCNFLADKSDSYCDSVWNNLYGLFKIYCHECGFMSK